MKKDQKRKQKLQERAFNESLKFQTMYGAKQKFGEVTPEIEARLNEEILVFMNMGIAEDLLRLKNTMEAIVKELGYMAEPSKGILAGSYVAYSLGLEPGNPMETGKELNPDDFQPPLNLTVSYDNEIRNKVVDWLKSHQYEVSTYLSQPLLILGKIRVHIRRVVKS